MHSALHIAEQPVQFDIFVYASILICAGDQQLTIWSKNEKC